MKKRVFLLLLLTLPAWAGEPASSGAPAIGPAGVPAVDVEANVRRMLEESRDRQGAPAAEALPPVSPSAGPKTPPPLTAPAAVPAPAKAKSAEAKPAPVASKPAAGPSTHVPLPEVEITIRSVEDVKSVHEQLQEARRRKAGEAPAPEPARQ